MSLLLQTPRAAFRRLLRPGAPSPLRDRVVLITGASSGIGAATARAVAARGATVLLVARRAEVVADLADELVASGGRAAAYPCDLTDGDGIDALVARVLADHGAVDYLVNNAGRSIRRSLRASHDRFHDFERTMAINYFGPVRLTMGLLPAMRDQQFGHVVNIVSWGVQLKAPRFAAYLASKSALDTWSRIAARESWDDNITFTNMRFGLVRTPMVVMTEEESRWWPAMTAAEAAAKVVRALEDRPVSWNIAAGCAGELLNLLTPRLADFVMHRMDLMGTPTRGADVPPA